jgi:hypothetical protein
MWHRPRLLGAACHIYEMVSASGHASATRASLDTTTGWVSSSSRNRALCNRARETGRGGSATGFASRR